MRVLPLILLLLAGCSERHDVMQDLPNSSIAGAPREDMPEARIESTLARAVTIGEDGPSLAACGGVGEVQGLADGQSLDLRAAPFSDARPVIMKGATASYPLKSGERLFICTHSIDQRWLGVVVPTNIQTVVPTDCGVSSPVESKRAYDGPCPSGWVAASVVRAVGR